MDSTHQVQRMQAELAGLDERRTTEHFDLRFEKRSRPGRRSRTHGIREGDDIDLYVEALERGYQTLTGWGFLDYVASEGRQTRVLIFDLSRFFPFTHGLTVPVKETADIFLPSFRGGPSRRDERHLMESTAIHECFHTFQHRCHAFLSPAAGDWFWADEASAVFLERALCTGGKHYLEHALAWCDHPDRGLENRSAAYSSSLFVTYLVEQFGSEILPQWYEFTHALDGLVEILRARGVEFVTDDPNRIDFFSCGYCVDSWFLKGWLPDVHERYGQRMITEPFTIQAGESITCQPASIEPLACRYYRVGGVTGAQSLEIESPAGAGVRYLVVPADAAGERLPCNLIAWEGDRFPLPSDADHAILVVVNTNRDQAIQTTFTLIAHE